MSLLHLHVGTHKTGSSSLQHAARCIAANHPDELSFVERPRRILKTLMTSTSVSGAITHGLKKAVSTHMRRSGSRINLFTSETLCGNPWNAYKNTGVVAETLGKATLEYKPVVTLYLRRQDEFIESMYIQSIQEGGSKSFSSFLTDSGLLGGMDYLRIVQSFEDTFGRGNVVVRSFHAASRVNLIKDFYASLGLGEFANTVEFPRRNESFSRFGLAVAERANARLTYDQSGALRSALRSTMPKRVGSRLPLLSNAQRTELYANNRDQYQRLADEYMNLDIDEAFPLPKMYPGGGDFQQAELDQARLVGDMVVELLQGLDSAGLAKTYLRRILAKSPKALSFARRLKGK